MPWKKTKAGKRVGGETTGLFQVEWPEEPPWRVTEEQIERNMGAVGTAHVCRNRHEGTDRGNRKCQLSEAETCLACSRNINKASIAGVG